MTRPEETSIAERWSLLREALNEAQRRLLLGVEAKILGDRGISVVARATNSSRATVRAGLDDIRDLVGGNDDTVDPGDPVVYRPSVRVRREGAGRKSLREKFPDLVPTLMKLVEPEHVLGRLSPLLWATKTREKLVQELCAHEYQVSGSAVLDLLREESFRVDRAYKPRLDPNWPEPHDQFAFVSQRVALAQNEGQPVVAIELFRVLRSAPITDGAASFTAGLRRRYNYQFEDEDPEPRRDGQCEVCGATQHQPGEVALPSSETIDFAVVALEQWWKRAVTVSSQRAGRLVLVVAGLAGNEPAMRQLRVRLSVARASMQTRLEVLHVPAGIRRWRQVNRKYTLATNDYVVDRTLERHEITLEFPGTPRHLLHLVRDASQSSIDADPRLGERRGVDPFEQFQSWNYEVAG